MKKLSKILFVALVSIIGLMKVNAKPFVIENSGVEYDTLQDAVNAAPIDGTQVTIVMTEDVSGGAGVKVQEGKNLVIDFGGHRFETEAPMVGSTGTETQSFQLLKGSTVHMKNGLLIPSTRADSKMFIQNYSNLTLEDITIDGSTNPNSGFYAVSSNYGTVRFIGNTNIKVNPEIASARAFDMCWAPRVGTGYPYAGGTQMVIDTTGKIEGLIELDVWGTYYDADGINSTLTIKNIDFEGTWSIDERLEGQLSIEGGKFNSSVEDYVAAGKAEYTTGNGVFEVLPTGTINLTPKTLYIQKGKTANLTVEVEEVYKKFVTYDVVHSGVASYSNGTVTGNAVGSTTLNATLGKLGDSVGITVYEVVPAANENENTEEVNENATSVAVQVVEEALTNDEVEGLTEEVIEGVKDAVLAGKTVETEIVVEEVKKEDIEEEVVNTIEEAVNNDDGVVAGYLDIDMLLKTSTETIGNVTKLPNPITISVEVGEELGAVPENATRQYFVVRLHNGETTVLEATYENGKLSFQTDRFSQYAYGYVDTLENTIVEPGTNEPDPVNNTTEPETTIPQTGDNLPLYLTILVVSVLGIAGTLVLRKKKLAKVSK